MIYLFGIYFSLLLKFLVIECDSTQNYLQFDSIIKEKSLKYLLMSKTVTLDASSTNQILVQNYRKFDSKNVNIILFHCRVKPLSNDSQILMAEICFKPTLKSNEACYNVLNTDIIEVGPALSIKINRNYQTGFSAEFNTTSNIRSNDGLYYCKVGNKHHTIVSNYIELENIAYQFTNQLDKFDPIKPTQSVKITDFNPISLHCGRNIYADSKQSTTFTKSPFNWVFWENYRSEQKSLPTVNNMMEFVQHQNGTLEIFRFLKKKSLITLMCINVLSWTDYSTYELEINIEEQSGPYRFKIQSISPMNSRIVLREGPVGFIKETLAAIYYSNPFPKMTKNAVWKRNNDPLNRIYPDSSSNNYNFLFPDFIDNKFSGQYNLLVEQGEPIDHTMFTFDVEVITVPKFKTNPSQIAYKIAGQSVDFLVGISGNISSMEVYIDDELIPMNRNETGFNASYRNNVDQDIIEVSLNIPNVTINMTQPKSYLVAESNKKKIENARFDRIYTITFVANNKNLTSSKLISFLKVFEYPKLAANIKLDDCLQSDRNTLSFVTNTHKYVNAGFEVNHIWTMMNADNQPITDMRQYAVIRNATAFMNVSSDLIGLQFRYQLQIFQRTPARILIFDSNNQPDLVQLLQTRISCIDKSEFPIAIVAIIIGLLVASIAVLILVLCLTKKKGETYNIDKNERAMGHDPEAECRENETFLNYERQNDDLPAKGSRMSVINDDSIGENSDGGELDDDGIDTASYSEEGSFINEYSTNSRMNNQPKSKPTDNSKDSLV